jgi:hypothetical protein
VLSIGLWKHLALFLLWLESEPTVIKSLLDSRFTLTWYHCLANCNANLKVIESFTQYCSLSFDAVMHTATSIMSDKQGLFELGYLVCRKIWITKVDRYIQNILDMQCYYNKNQYKHAHDIIELNLSGGRN